MNYKIKGFTLKGFEAANLSTDNSVGIYKTFPINHLTHHQVMVTSKGVKLITFHDFVQMFAAGVVGY